MKKAIVLITMVLLLATAGCVESNERINDSDLSIDSEHITHNNPTKDITVDILHIDCDGDGNIEEVTDKYGVSAITTSSASKACTNDGIGAEQSEFSRSEFHIWTQNAIDK